MAPVLTPGSCPPLSVVPSPAPRLIPVAVVPAVLSSLPAAWPVSPRVPALPAGPLRLPRLRRGLNHVHRLLRQGDWHQALHTVHDLQARVRPDSSWGARLRSAEGECHRVAGISYVQAGEYETGLEHHLQAAALLNLNEL